MVEVRVILPGYNTKVLNMDLIKPYETDGLKLSVAYVPIPVDAVRHEFDMALMAPGLLKQVMLAEQEKVDAIVIDLMAEVALRALREAVSIPVVSLPQTTMHVAAMMGNRFAIINTTQETTPIQENLARNYGLWDKVATVQGLQLDPLADYHSEETINSLIDQCYDAVHNKHADVLIFGSGRLIAYRDRINKGLQERGVNVPIIEPLPTGIYFARFLVDAKIAQSKLVYPTPDAAVLKTYVDLLK